MNRKKIGFGMILCVLLTIGFSTIAWGKAPGKVSVTSQKSNNKTDQYTVYWSRMSDVDGYQMRLYDVNSGSYVWSKKELSGGATKVILNDIDAGQYYRFQIRTYVEKENASTGKITRTYGSYRTLYIAQQPKVKFKWYSQVRARATWKTIEGADSYVIYLKRPGGTYRKLGTTKNTQYLIPRLVSGEKYYVYVVARNKVKGQTYYTPRTYSYSFRLQAN